VNSDVISVQETRVRLGSSTDSVQRRESSGARAGRRGRAEVVDRGGGAWYSEEPRTPLAARASLDVPSAGAPARATAAHRDGDGDGDGDMDVRAVRAGVVNVLKTARERLQSAGITEESIPALE
jgi:hypothetical protein